MAKFLADKGIYISDIIEKREKVSYRLHSMGAQPPMDI